MTEAIHHSSATNGRNGFRNAVLVGIGVWVTLMFLFLAACIVIDWH